MESEGEHETRVGSPGYRDSPASREPSVHEIGVAIEKTPSGDSTSPDVMPKEIRWLTRKLASRDPPDNPLVAMKIAAWWYIHGEGESDPAFRWAIEWTQHLATGVPGDVSRFEAFLDYLVSVGLAEDWDELR